MNRRKKSTSVNKTLMIIILIMICIGVLLGLDILVIRTIKKQPDSEVKKAEKQIEAMSSESESEFTVQSDTSSESSEVPMIEEITTESEAVTEKITETVVETAQELETIQETETIVKSLPSIFHTTAEDSSNPVFQYAFATSTLQPTVTQNKIYYYNADNILTTNLNTSWTEGAAGDGTGESITVYSNEVQHIKKLILYNGIFENEEIFYMNCRIKECRITLSNGESYEVTLDGEYSAQPCVLSFTEAVDTDSLTITILSSYLGSEYDDNGITSLQFVGE